MHRPLLLVAATALAAILPAQEEAAQERTQSKTPPGEAPWTTDFLAAHAEAARRNVPIFVYSTKTYCPHCVVMEKTLLSDPALASTFDDVVWMYLFQDFSGSPADRAAQRVAIRFGITAWPQHFLVDPHSMEVLADTGRTLESFTRAVKGATVAERDDGLQPEDLAAADARAAALHDQPPGQERLVELLGDDDVVVRYRAIELLKDAAPKRVVAAAGELLAVPHDQTRFLVCEVLATHGDASAREALEALVRDPAGSRNPNVLRIRATQALARCGDARSLEVLAPIVQAAQCNNGLSTLAVDTAVALGEESAEARAQAARVLLDGFPAPGDSADDPRMQRMCAALAARVHGALGRLTGTSEIGFPEVYDAKSRAALRQAWAALVR